MCRRPLRLGDRAGRGGPCAGGLDEASLAGTKQLRLVEQGAVQGLEIDPAGDGSGKRLRWRALAGGDLAIEPAESLRTCMQGRPSLANGRWWH